MSKLVGVIGGMGPMATTKFMELVINNTKAEKDQDNVDMLVCQYSSTPDRTAYILGNSNEDPGEAMIKAAKLLESEKCDFLVMPCNTATFFYDKIAKEISVPLINIAEETVKHSLKIGAKKIGLMATDGTIKASVYDQYIPEGITLFKPDEEHQKRIMDVIYKEVKQNLIPNKENFIDIINYFKNNGCDVVVMGCTELSVAVEQLDIDDPMVVDSLTVLAKLTIVKADKLLK